MAFSLNPARWWPGRGRRTPPIAEDIWQRVREDLPLLAGLDRDETRRLGDLALGFLRHKTIELPHPLDLGQEDRLAIALQACLPILNLGLDWYRDWYALILYPDEFVPEREWVDENGLVWVSREPMSGEAWEQGPVILSWADVQAGGVRDGYNVILHEMAHKLDMLTGPPNGHPPLHAGMSAARWATALGMAFADLRRRMERDEETTLDPYGTESPGEFFAVCCEAFFEIPHGLMADYPAVYDQLRDFFRQDPARRLAPVR